MNGYLLSVIGTVLLCSLLTAIAPEGKTSSIIKGMARLACILAIISPVLHFFKTGDLGKITDDLQENGIRTDKSVIEYYSEMRASAAEEGIEKELAEKYGVEVEVSLAWSLALEKFGDYEVEQIRVDGITVYGDSLDEEVKENMRVYLRKNYCSEVLIE